MVVHIYSDVILDSVARELENLINGVKIHLNYSEDLPLSLMQFDINKELQVDFIIIHSDQLFFRKPDEWQGSFFEVLNRFAIRYPNRILVTNCLGVSFSTSPQKKLINYWTYNFDKFKDAWENLLNLSNVFVFDFVELISKIGTDNAFSYNLGHLYQMPYSKVMIKEFAFHLSQQLLWLVSEEKKVIIVDCDNTLWKGILGEDGVEGIKCDINADGIIHYQFQQFLKIKKEEGFILAICTKNNEEEVIHAFDKYRMPLSLDDFVIKKINWQDKWINIKEIAIDLNLSVDSMIFIDDNQFELNSVREMLPGIVCFEFTQSYEHFLSITRNFLFRHRLILDDDLKKTYMYQQEFARKGLQSKYKNLDEFIQALDIRMDIRLNDMNDLDRLAQLTAKTNQFNFNKKEYNRDELESYIIKGNRVYSLKLSDKYGDYGTVGIIMLEISGNGGVLDNYLISCRALGKRVEYEFFSEVTELLRNEAIEIIKIRLKATEKNIPALKFYNTLNL